MGGRQRRRWWLAIVGAAVLAGGCTRQFFRERADADVEGILSQKNVFPEWAVHNWHVYPDPRSRFADPYSPDHPPYPPDDYATRLLSPNPQHPTKKSGVGRYEGTGYLQLLAEWDASNRAEMDKAVVPAGAWENVRDGCLAENSDQPAALPAVTGGVSVAIPLLQQRNPAPEKISSGVSEAETTDYLRALRSEQRGYRIKLHQAVELGLLNSREFQDRREDLYLAALQVTLARFNFAAQAFFTEQVFRRWTGRELGGGELWDINTTAGLNKRFPTGATLLLQLANQVVIDLGSQRPDTAVSNLTLSVIQPFLRGGGLAVNLENLTAAERNLVYAMRSFARFRRIYYVSVAAGGGLTNNPYGLQGLAPNLGRGIGGNLTSPSVGFLQLLQQMAQIANQRKNVAELERLLRLYRAFREGGQQSDLQVGQVEVSMLGSRANLLNGGGGAPGLRQYLDQLDNFKLQLGLPLTVDLDLDDAPLRPIREQLTRFEAIYADLRAVEEAARQFDPQEPVERFRERWRRLLTESALVKGTDFARGIEQRWESWQRLNQEQWQQRMGRLRQERTELLNRRTERQQKGEPEPPQEIALLETLENELALGVFEQAVRQYEQQPWLKEKGPQRESVQAAAFREVVNSFYQVVLEARGERLRRVRQQWPALPPVLVEGVDILQSSLDEAYTAGMATALTHRLDLMNARALVVDAWRQIAVQANSLQGVFDVRYDMTASSPAGESQPFAFSADRTRHQLTLRAELPLVRRAERNNYRAALISYQRQRRNLMAFEDNIANDVRADIRQLRTLAELYRIQQRVVELAYSQVDNAQAVLLQPPDPQARADPGSAAALTLQVLQTQSSLLSAQNQLFTLWVSYLTARMQFYLDLELLHLDERGVWNDDADPGDRQPVRVAPRRWPAERLPYPYLVPNSDPSASPAQ
ncbi:MAG: TolC family protein [Thermogemmata sp.]|nr:TolC family protein [Thermogemmata sp.]